MWNVARSAAIRVCIIMLACNAFCAASSAQWRKSQGEFSQYAGDSPAIDMPYAQGLSPVIGRREVAEALRKVADWQLTKSRQHFDRDWTFSTLYAGFMALPQEVGGDKYSAAMRSMGDSFHWKLGRHPFDANDQALAQTYLALYKAKGKPRMLHPTQKKLDLMLTNPDTAEASNWWWCDSLFMAPPVYAELSSITGRQDYINYMDREWWKTSAALYDQKRHLFYRDKRFLNKRDPHGQPVFWSRGNGWVLGGLVRVLQVMPKDYPTRSRYIEQFQQMAAALVALQGADGLWSMNLLDSADEHRGETSGTSLITYALAYGINSGILDREHFQPVVSKAWEGLVAHIYADGRLGAVQPVADSPGHFKPTSSYVYGVGAFLLAGSQVYEMNDRETLSEIR
jgi:rhamnogalacturonyl hydrolase YesR